MFFKIIPLVFNILIPVSFALVKATLLIGGKLHLLLDAV